MHSTRLTLGALAAVATAALVGPGVAVAASSGSNPTATTAATPADTPVTATATSTGETTHEVGKVIECTGTIRHRTVFASVYENNTVTDVIQVVIGRGTHQLAGGREVEAGFVHHREVHGRVRVGGDPAVIQGRVFRYGDRIPVHDEIDDAGQHIVVDGFHRMLGTDLTLSWRQRQVGIDCPSSFVYDLETTRTPLE